MYTLAGLCCNQNKLKGTGEGGRGLNQGHRWDNRRAKGWPRGKIRGHRKLVIAGKRDCSWHLPTKILSYTLSFWPYFYMHSHQFGGYCIRILVLISNLTFFKKNSSRSFASHISLFIFRWTFFFFKASGKNKDCTLKLTFLQKSSCLVIYCTFKGVQMLIDL